MKEIIYSSIITLLLPVIIASVSLESYTVLGFAVLAVLLLIVLLYQSYHTYKFESKYIAEQFGDKTALELKIEQSEKNIRALLIDFDKRYNDYDLLEKLTRVDK